MMMVVQNPRNHLLGCVTFSMVNVRASLHEAVGLYAGFFLLFGQQIATS